MVSRFCQTPPTLIRLCHPANYQPMLASEPSVCTFANLLNYDVWASPNCPGCDAADDALTWPLWGAMKVASELQELPYDRRNRISGGVDHPPREMLLFAGGAAVGSSGSPEARGARPGRTPKMSTPQEGVNGDRTKGTERKRKHLLQ